MAIVEIVGKQHIHGISKKTGNPYDFCDVYYLGRRKGVEGLAAVKKTVGADIISADDIIVGAMHDLTLDDEGNVIDLRKVDSKPTAGQHSKD